MSHVKAIQLLNILVERHETREKNGYTQVFLEGEWQWLHRVIAKEKMGSDIYDGFEVHHIDGEKKNNHPDNLKVLSKEEHQALHEQPTETKNDVDQDVRNYISQRIKHLQTNKNRAGGQRTRNTQVSDSSSLINQIKADKMRSLAAIRKQLNRHSLNSDFFDMEPYDGVCMRCGGTGYLPEYNHVEGGICFACGGTGGG